MDFREATDLLSNACITLQDIADAAGVSPNAIRRARLGGGSEHARKPPADWEYVLAQLARNRANALLKIAKRLESAR